MVWRAKLRWNHSGIFGDGALIFGVCRSAEETSRGRVEMGSVGGGVEPAIEAAAKTGAGGGSGFFSGTGAGSGGGDALATVFSGSLAGGATGSDLRESLADFAGAATTGAGF